MTLHVRLRAALIALPLAACSARATGRGQDKQPWDVPLLKDAFKGKFLIGTALDLPPPSAHPSMDVAIAMHTQLPLRVRVQLRVSLASCHWLPTRLVAG